MRDHRIQAQLSTYPKSLLQYICCNTRLGSPCVFGIYVVPLVVKGLIRIFIAPARSAVPRLTRRCLATSSLPDITPSEPSTRCKLCISAISFSPKITAKAVVGGLGRRIPLQVLVPLTTAMREASSRRLGVICCILFLLYFPLQL